MDSDCPTNLIVMEAKGQEHKASVVPEPPEVTKAAIEGHHVESVMEDQVRRLAEKVWGTLATLELVSCYVSRHRS